MLHSYLVQKVNFVLEIIEGKFYIFTAAKNEVFRFTKIERFSFANLLFVLITREYYRSQGIIMP